MRASDLEISEWLENMPDEESQSPDAIWESEWKKNLIDAAIGRASVAWRADVSSVDGQTITGGEMATIFPNPVRLGVRTEEKLGKEHGVTVSTDAVDKDDA